MLADSGASDHFVDDELIPGLHRGVREYKKLKKPRPTEISGTKEFATATGTEDRRTHGLQASSVVCEAWPSHPSCGVDDTINADMLIVGFTPTQPDPCVYTPERGDTIVILTLYFTGICRHLDRQKGRGCGEVPRRRPSSRIA